MEWIAWYIILLNWLQYLILKPPLHKVGVPTCVELVGRRPLPYPGPPPRGYRSRWPVSRDRRRTGPPPREPTTPRSFLWWNKQIESQQIRLFTTETILGINNQISNSKIIYTICQNIDDFISFPSFYWIFEMED